VSNPIQQSTGGALPTKRQQPPTDWSQASAEDYNAALMQSLQSDSTSTSQTDKQQSPETPIHGFWHRLLFGVEGTSRVKEAARSVPRGFAGAANSIGRAAFELGAVTSRRTGIGERITPGYNAAYDEAGGARQFLADENTDIVDTNEAYGQRSDDPLASFAESTVQFVSGMALLGGTKGPGIIVRAALSDAIAFNPYEAQLAELAARAPNWTGIGLLGKLLSVEGDDNALVARIKRSAAGAISGALIDGLIAGVRFIRWSRALSKTGMTSEARAAGEAAMREARETLERVSEGLHASEGQHVVVKPTPNGQFTLGVNPKSPIVGGVSTTQASRHAEFDALGTEARDLSLIPQAERTPEQVARLFEVGELKKQFSDLLEPPARTAEEVARAAEIPESLPRDIIERERRRVQQPVDVDRRAPSLLTDVDPNNLNVAHAAKERARFEVTADQLIEMSQNKGIGVEQAAENLRRFSYRVPNEIVAQAKRQTIRQERQIAEEFLDNSGVQSTSRGELETQAAVMNDALDARIQASSSVSSAELAQHQQFAKELFAAQTPAEIAARAETANFNLSYYATQPEVMAQIEAISKQFRSAMDEVQSRPGGVPVEESIRIAREAIGGMTEREAPAVIVAKLKTTEDLHAWLLASDMVMRDQGKRLARMSELLDARPHDVIAHEEARIALENFYQTTREVAGANSEVGRSLRILQERASASALSKPLKFKAEGATAAAKSKVTAPTEPVQITAGMSHREIAAQARMIRMADGAPRDVFAVAHAAQVIKNTSNLSRAFELFANFLLSGPRTVQTVFVSGAGLNIFEPSVRMLAGAATGNRALFREGADIMWGNFKYISENIKGMRMSLNAGRSIINPQPQHIAIGGVTGDVVRIPGRVLGAADEFSRLTAYRAFVRAKSLRLGREQGLTGAALEERVVEDLRAAFDTETGIATLPEALRYAEVPTMAAPLGRETFGGGFQTFVNNHLEARFIAPFVKASVNIFRYVHKSIPGLNLLNREVREALARGGEEAAIIHTRSAVAGSLYAFGLYQASAGNLTGRGPSDPDLRRLWLGNTAEGKGRQPYSIRVGGKWISYARLDPLAMPLGLMADLSTIIHESDEKAAEPTDMAYATVSALFYNLSSKSYLSGITQFSEAWGSNDPHATARWMQNFAANAAVPQLANSLNPDDVYRDVQGLADAIIARIPGWSTTLDPRFDIFGEPMMKTPGLLNRNQILTAKDTGRSVEDDLLTLGHGLSPLTPKIEGGLINLQDRNTFDNGTGKSPFIRMMELIRRPADGSPSLREAMNELVRSSTWQEASDGTSLFPGGERWIRAAALKNKYESRALRQVMDEYPKLMNQIRAVRRMRGAAITSGESGVQQIEQLFGVSPR